MPNFGVILPAAGQSSRFQDKDKKPFANLDGRAVWLRTVELFVSRPEVGQCIVVLAPEDQEMFKIRYRANLVFMNVEIANGGSERFESVENALRMLKPEIDFVAVHDAVRPCVTETQISDVFQQATKTGAALLAQPVTDTVKQVDKDRKVQATVPRQGLWLAQTPQVFRRDWLEASYAQRGKLGRGITDDAQLVESAGYAVQVVEGSSSNLKITTRNDLHLAEAILKSRPKPKATGSLHPFAEDKEMWK